MALSPLQERINQLSARIVETDDFEEFQRLASELRTALREQVAHLRAMVDEAKKAVFSSPSRLDPKRDKKSKSQKPQTR